MTNRLFELARQKMLNPKPNLLVTGATNATPIVITTDRAHGLATADQVTIFGTLGNTAANGTWVITFISSTTFSLDTSVGSGAYTAATGEVLLADAYLKKMTHVIRWGTGSTGGGNRNYGDDFKAVLVNVSGAGTLYTVDINQHEFLSDVTAGARVSTSPIFASKTTSTGAGATLVGGVADMDDIVWTAVGPSGLTVEAFVVYKDTGTEATSSLVAYVDTATGLAFTANGSMVTFSVDAGSNRFMKI